MWIKMTNPSTPEETGGQPRIIAHADKVTVGATTLDQLTAEQGAAAGWFTFTQVVPNENFYELGDATYITAGTGVHRVYNTPVFKNIEQIRRWKLGKLRGQMKFRRRWMTHGAKQYDAAPERAGYIALLLQVPRKTGYRVEARDGTFVTMNTTEFQNYARRMATHIEAIDTRNLALRDLIDTEVDEATLINVDETSGW